MDESPQQPDEETPEEATVSEDQQELEWEPGPVDRQLPGSSVEQVHKMWADEFTKLEDGGMQLHIIDLIPVHGEITVVQPHHTVQFGPEDWAIFKKRVAADGKRPPRVVPAYPNVILPDNGRPQG